MDYITIPHTCKRLYVGSIVMIERFSDTKWVLQNGWYMYDNQQYNGWYFNSIPTQTSIPVEECDLINIKIVSEGCNNHECCPQIGCLPQHAVHHHRVIEKYLQGVNYVSGQFVYLKPGEVYQVVDRFRSGMGLFVEDSLKTDIKNGHLIPVGYNSGSKVYGLNFKSIFDTDIPTIEMTDNYLLNIGIKPVSGIIFINTDSVSATYLNMLMYTEIDVNDTSTLILTRPMSSYYSKNEIDEKFIYATEQEVRSMFD